MVKMQEWWDEEVLEQFNRQYLEHKNTTVQEFLEEPLKLPRLVKDFNPVCFSYSEAKIEKRFFPKEVERFVSKVIGRDVILSDCRALRFEHRDYIILHDLMPTHKHPLVLLHHNPDLKAQWKESWGGYFGVKIEDEVVAKFLPCKNAFTVFDAKGTRNYFKYVNHKAPMPVTFVIATCKPLTKNG